MNKFDKGVLNTWLYRHTLRLVFPVHGADPGQTAAAVAFNRIGLTG